MSPLRPLAVEMLRLAHLEPGITRADAARHLGVGTGTASDLAASLVKAGWIVEQPQRATARGRPTRELVAAPQGPIVLAAAIRHTAWQIDAVALGNHVIASQTGRHQGVSGPATLAAMATAVTDMRSRFRDRVQGLGVSGPGLVHDGHRLDATMLGWRDLDLRQIWPDAPLFTAGNDATLAAVAEGCPRQRRHSVGHGSPAHRGRPRRCPAARRLRGRGRARARRRVRASADGRRRRPVPLRCVRVLGRLSRRKPPRPSDRRSAAVRPGRLRTPDPHPRRRRRSGRDGGGGRRRPDPRPWSRGNRQRPGPRPDRPWRPCPGDPARGPPTASAAPTARG